MRSGGKAVARRASALLMSALLAFSTCPVEALGQDENATDAQPGQELVENNGKSIDEPQIPEQEPLPEESAANETEELNTTDPQAIPETEEPVEEEHTEEENVQVTEEERVEEVTTDDEGTESDEQGLSVMSEGTDYYFEKDSSEDYDYNAKVRVNNVSKGTVSYNTKTRTLTLNNVTCEDIYASHDLTIVLVGTNTVTDYYAISADGHTLVFKGKGALKLTSRYSSNRVKCKQLKISSGIIKGHIEIDSDNSSVAISGGSVSGSIRCGTLTMTGGSVSYKGTGSNDSTNVVDCVSLIMKGGSIKASKCGSAINCREMTMTGGSLYAEDCDRGIYANTSQSEKVAKVTIKKGKVVVTNPSHEGIYLQRGNLYIQGGSVAIKGAYEDAIEAWGIDYRGKRYGGKVKITGGKLVATTRQSKNSSYSAIYADSITNKPSCLKKIVGRLSTGARFESGGNTYQVSDYSDVNIYRYGSKKTEAKFKQVTYGKYKYEVTGVAANAFNTKRGAALTSITFRNYMREFGANAFKGTKSLRKLTFRQGFSNVYTTRNGSKYKLKVDKQYFKCNKKAFSGAGANGGSGLMVTMRGGTDQAHLYRNLLLTRGLPSSAKVTTTYFNN